MFLREKKVSLLKLWFAGVVRFHLTEVDSAVESEMLRFRFGITLRSLRFLDVSVH